LAGPVGIVKTTGDATRSGLANGLRLVAMLTSYFLFLPIAFALAVFPRRPR
jgi:hypothetical protein